MPYRYVQAESDHPSDGDEDDEIYWNEQDLCQIAFDLRRDAERRFERFLVDLTIPVVKTGVGKVVYTQVTEFSKKDNVQRPPRLFVPPNLAAFNRAKIMHFSRRSDAKASWYLHTNGLRLTGEAGVALSSLLEAYFSCCNLSLTISDVVGPSRS
ncbi:hypothetical protein JCM10295v2_001056 [Rhodotorula toruloides]